ncbi:MAG: SPL family radical SAM protein [Methanomassiliicoccales archaeon]
MEDFSLKSVNQALHPLKRRGLPYKYDLNAYMGCSHNCRYCYTKNDFGVVGKSNLAELLDRQLSSPDWQRDIINLGGSCDNYQPAEAEASLMPAIWEVLLRHQAPVIISTKSNLILRDYDLIDRLAATAYVNVVACITSTSTQVAAAVEPGAASPASRFQVLEEFSRSQAYTGFHVLPILPLLADDDETLENLVSWAAEAKVSYMMTGMLYLTGGIKSRYLGFLNEHFPQYYDEYLHLYPRGGADPAYKQKIHSYLAVMREKYGVNSSYSKFLPRK